MKKRMRYDEFARETDCVMSQMTAELGRHDARMKTLRLKIKQLHDVHVDMLSENDARPEPPEAA